MVTTYPDILARPYHLEQFKSFYTTGDEIEGQGDLTTQKAAFLSALAGRLNTFKGLFPFPSEAAFESEVDSLYTAVAADFNTDIPDDVDVAIDKIDALEAIKQDAITIITTDTDPDKIRIYECPSCLQLGTIEVEGTEVQDPLCEGYLYTKTAKQLVQGSRQWEDA